MVQWKNTEGLKQKHKKTARLRRKTNLQKSDYPKTRIKRDPNALCVVEYDNCVCIKQLLMNVLY